MENEPFEDVFPIENGDFPLLCLITGVYLKPPPRQGKPIVNKPFGGAKTPPASLRWPEQSPGGCVGRLVFVLVKKKIPGIHVVQMLKDGSGLEIVTSTKSSWFFKKKCIQKNFAPIPIQRFQKTK